MKKLTLAAALIAAATTLSSCGSLGSAAGALLGGQTGAAAGNLAQGVVGALTNGNTISNLLSTFLGGVPLTEESIYGTWTYQGVDVAFESETLLAKAGGAVAAGTVEQKIDEQLQKYGIKAGAVKFTFNKDHTFTAKIGGQNINGTYTFDPQTRKLNLVAALGLFNQTCTVGTTAKGISLLFPADKLLSLAQMAGGLLGQANSTIGALSQLVTNYKGMQIGLEMSK